MKTIIRLSAIGPTTNHIWRHTTSRTTGKPVTYRQRDYMTWLNAVGYEVNRQASDQPKWDAPVYITMAMRRPRTNADLDNRIKSHLDLLQSHKVISDDKLVNGINAYWSEHLPDGVAVEIAITAADSPIANTERVRARSGGL